MEGNVVNNLCSLPATDLNFTSELNRATAYQIKQAIEKMKQNGGKNKGRIKACERELENRRLTKKDKNGKYVSKEDYQWTNPDYPDCEDCGEWLNWLQSDAEMEKNDGR